MPAKKKVPAKKVSAAKKVLAKKAAGLAAESKITIVAAENPKRKGTAAYKRFAKYQNGQTVESALSKGLQRRDINYDLQHGFIQVA